LASPTHTSPLSLRDALPIYWDLLIRMAEVTDFELAPFVATRYDVWEDRTDRITINEPLGYRYAVLGKHLVDWPAVEAAAAQRRPDRKSTRLNSSHVKISYAV